MLLSQDCQIFCEKMWYNSLGKYQIQSEKKSSPK